jgi:hypothetical protein
MLPPAPGRLSTTTCWPSFSLSLGTSMRTTASALPPGGKVTTIRIGLLGKSLPLPCARAGPASSAQAATSGTRTRAKFLVIVVPS